VNSAPFVPNFWRNNSPWRWGQSYSTKTCPLSSGLQCSLWQLFISR